MSGLGRNSETRNTEPEAILNNRTQFLLAELGHFEQSLLQNEQMGEGRFRFFLTLITATIAGLVALHTATGEILRKQEIQPIVIFALILLLLFGVLTYLRMLQRDRVSEGYKQDLKYIRGLLRDELGLTHYEVPFSPHVGSVADYTSSAEKWPFLRKKWLWCEIRLRAGYAQTVGAMCALLLGMLVLYMYLTGNLGWLIKVNSVLVILGVLIFVVLYFVASDSAVRNKDKAERHAKAARGKAEECAMFARMGYRRGCQ